MGDLNADGLMDIAVANRGEANRVYLGAYPTYYIAQNMPTAEGVAVGGGLYGPTAEAWQVGTPPRWHGARGPCSSGIPP